MHDIFKILYDTYLFIKHIHILGTDKLIQVSVTRWSRGMNLVLGPIGPGFKSRTSPLLFTNIGLSMEEYCPEYLLQKKNNNNNFTKQPVLKSSRAPWVCLRWSSNFVKLSITRLLMFPEKNCVYR